MQTGDAVKPRPGLRRLLRDQRGNSSVEFIMTTGLLILLFMTLVAAMIYVTQYYNASYICRRVVRTIETAGEYDATAIRTMAGNLGGGSLEDLEITVDAHYVSEHKIQLRENFHVTLEGLYKVNILQFGDNTVTLDLPISIKMSGMSEVFWK